MLSIYNQLKLLPPSCLESQVSISWASSAVLVGIVRTLAAIDHVKVVERRQIEGDLRFH